MILKNKNNSKGFTLTELIIVIVIIGILAAVLIPSITHYIEKARLSNDKSAARNMTMLLSLEAYDTDKSYFEPNYVISFLQMNGYDIKTSSKGNSFCYDYLNNKVTVTSNDSLGILSADSNPDFDHKLFKNPINKVRYLNGYLYIDQSNTEITKSIDTLSNLLDLALATGSKNIGNTMQELYNDAVKMFGANPPQYIEELNPSTTVYVNETGYYSNSTNQIRSIIVVNGTTSIPELPETEYSINLTRAVYVPSTVIEVKNNSIFDTDEFKNSTVDIVVGNAGVESLLPDEVASRVEVIINKVTTTLQNVLITYTISDTVIKNTDSTELKQIERNGNLLLNLLQV